MLIYYILHYLYLYIFYSHLRLPKYNYKNISNIYTINQSKKVIIFLSGSFYLNNSIYINKTIHDLNNEYANIMNNYKIIIFEKVDKASIIVYEDLVNYIIDLHNEINIEELILIGFSFGGIVASHTMNKLNNYKFTKKVIIYDTPWNMINNMKKIQTNKFYRFDYISFHYIYSTYCNHYNYNEIEHILKSYNRFSNGDAAIELIKKVHKMTDDEVNYYTSININLNSDVSVVNIYCTSDPIVDYQLNFDYINSNKKNFKFRLINIEKDRIGHCTDMCYDTKYLSDLINAIQI